MPRWVRHSPIALLIALVVVPVVAQDEPRDWRREFEHNLTIPTFEPKYTLSYEGPRIGSAVFSPD